MPNGPKTRPELALLGDYVPGKSTDEVREKYGLDSVVKLASNENPLGPSPRAVEAAVRVLSDAHRYPQGHAPSLTAALAAKLGVAPGKLVFSNGSDEMVQMVAEAWIAPGSEVLICEPTFSEYRFAAQLAGAEVRALPLKEGRFDLDALLGAVTERTSAVFVCCPNNPTGGWNSRAELLAFLDALPERVLLVLDQAYGEFAPAAGASDYDGLLDQTDRPNLVLLRTFSKIHALAGLRIGYAVASPELVRALYKVKQPFNVGLVSQAAAVAALGDDDHMERSLRLVSEGMASLRAVFASWGWTVLPSAANFLAVKPSRGSAKELVAELESQGLILRWMASFGMPDFFRITIGTKAENARFVELADAWRRKQ